MILDKGCSCSGEFTTPGVQAQLLHLYLEKARAVSTNSSCTQELAPVYKGGADPLQAARMVALLLMTDA